MLSKKANETHLTVVNTNFCTQGRAMASAFTYDPLTALAWVQSQTSMCRIGGGRSGTGRGFCPNTLVSCVSVIP